MKRIGPFFFGVLVGAAAVYGSLRYHVVRTKDGVEFVPKTSATFSQAYVDVRSYGASEWAEHPDLAMALVRADKHEVIQGAAIDQFERGVDQVFRDLTGANRGTVDR